MHLKKNLGMPGTPRSNPPVKVSATGAPARTELSAARMQNPLRMLGTADLPGKRMPGMPETAGLPGKGTPRPMQTREMYRDSAGQHRMSMPAMSSGARSPRGQGAGAPSHPPPARLGTSAVACLLLAAGIVTTVGLSAVTFTHTSDIKQDLGDRLRALGIGAAEYPVWNDYFYKTLEFINEKNKFINEKNKTVPGCTVANLAGEYFYKAGGVNPAAHMTRKYKSMTKRMDFLGEDTSGCLGTCQKTGCSCVMTTTVMEMSTKDYTSTCYLYYPEQYPGQYNDNRGRLVTNPNDNNQDITQAHNGHIRYFNTDPIDPANPSLLIGLTSAPTQALTWHTGNSPHFNLIQDGHNSRPISLSSLDTVKTCTDTIDYLLQNACSKMSDDLLQQANPPLLYDVFNKNHTPWYVQLEGSIYDPADTTTHKSQTWWISRWHNRYAF